LTQLKDESSQLTNGAATENLITIKKNTKSTKTQYKTKQFL